MTISSPHNPRLRHLRQLANRRRERDRTGHFVAEGEDLLAAADAAGWEPVERFAAAGSGLDGVEVEPELLARASQLGSGTRALGVYRWRWSAPAGPRCVYLHGVADPGNVGTVLRAADALCDGPVILGPGCADPYSPKAVRASMGSVFARPPARAPFEDLPGMRIALDAHGGEDVRSVGLSEQVAVCAGAERCGLPDAALAGADVVAHIPLRQDGPESLNVAMAAALALYELARRMAAHA
jgi:RNA methyltransferase, TrmH family